MLRALSILLMTLLSSISFAVESEEAMHAGIPKVVFYQALNFFGLLIVLYFLLRKHIVVYFAKRHDQLTAALREAKRLKDEAEKKHQEYSSKIQNLEGESKKLLDQIRLEGEASKKKIIEEGRRIADSIQEEAKRSAQNEIEKAQEILYNEVLEQAIAGARSLLTKAVADNDQRRLQKEFVEKIEAVQ